MNARKEPKNPYTESWKDKDWSKIRKYVFRLQKRIYRAEENGEKKKVRNLQRMLLHSKAALALAIKHVTQDNKGKRTAGIDGRIAISNKQREELFIEMGEMDLYNYKPKPVKRVGIPKKNGKTRYLGIPVIIDRVYQDLLRMALEPQAEFNFEPTSYGFRPERSQHDALERIWMNMKGAKWVWVFEGDFKACFDNISHDHILKQIKGFPAIKLVKKFLKSGYVEKGRFHETNKGTPQGGLISPLLANIALTGLEECFNITYRYAKNINAYVTKGDYRVVRFADDFVVFARTQEDILKIKEMLGSYLEDRGLELAEDKTRITHATEGFDFLGFNCRLYQNKNKLKCLITPSKDSQKAFKEKAKEIFRIHNGHNVDTLIKHLNPLLRGTANYWRAFSAKEVLSDMDSYIFHKCFKFVYRLHNNKGKKWLRQKYFKLDKDERYHNKWIFTAPQTGEAIIQMVRRPIFYPSMIQHNSSPYDPTKAEYFKSRRENR